MGVFDTGKTPLSLRVFRHAGRAELTTASGEPVKGRGIVTPLWRETGKIGGERCPLGELPRPLYRFVGYFPNGEALPGGVIAQGQKAYRVLDVKELCLGETAVCLRALLEEVVPNDDQ